MTAKTGAKTDAWMPLWIGAYLADTQHLARDEHGGYILLIMAYWRAGAPLPDDDKRLAAIARATPKEWKTLRPVMAEFFEVADGVWRHKRIEQELTDSKEKKTKASSKAQAAAKARWGNAESNAPSNAVGNATSMPQALHEECPTPTPTPSISVVEVGNTHTGSISEPGAPVCLAPALVCRRVIELGISPTTCNSGNPTLLALVAAGASMEEFEGAARTAVAKGKDFRYMLGIVTKQREDVARLNLHKGPLPGHSTNDQAREGARQLLFRNGGDDATT